MLANSTFRQAASAPDLTAREAVELVMTLLSAGRHSLAAGDIYAADAAFCAIDKAAAYALSCIDNRCENA